MRAKLAIGLAVLGVWALAFALMDTTMLGRNTGGPGDTARAAGFARTAVTAPPGPMPARIAPIPAPIPGLPPTEPTDDPTDDPGTGTDIAVFTMSSFNALGSSHTRPGNSRGFKTGPARVPGLIQILDQHGINVVGLQEFQRDQNQEFVKRAGRDWNIWPGISRSARDGENSIAWRKARWDLVQTRTVQITYFNGNIRNMPAVLLKHRTSGVKVWFTNFHNPADTAQFHHQAKWRAEAVRRELILWNQLISTGYPVFATGDFNERASFFCRVTAGAPIHAAAGGSNTASGCRAPSRPPIDWILASDAVVFDNYTVDYSALVKRTTDHHVYVVTAHVDGKRFPNAM